MSAGRRRILCLETAATVLRGMTGVRPWGGSYAHNPTVEIGYDWIFQDINVFPWIGLLPGPGSRVTRDEYGATSEFLDHFKVFCYGYIQGATLADRGELLMNLVEDCQRTLQQAIDTPTFKATRPGTTHPIADFVDFDEEGEDLIFHREGTGAEFLLPLTFRIPDTLGA